MAILMNSETRAALGGSAGHCRSRSLRFARFADPSLTKDDRKDFFTGIFALPPFASDNCHPLDRWLDWLQTGLRFTPDDLLFGKLQSRLALHLSGGVMENAGILLDRFGFPYIPGSGVKGIARRAALYALRTWCVDSHGVKPTDPAEPATTVCSPFGTPDDLAASILLAFGWTDAEWKDGRTSRNALRSDIEWATFPFTIQLPCPSWTPRRKALVTRANTCRRSGQFSVPRGLPAERHW